MTPDVKGPLAGLRVVEWGREISAPYCTKLLADFGANVVKVEEGLVGDEARRCPPFSRAVSGETPAGKFSLLFQYLNAGKRSVVIDLQTPAGKAAIRELALWADIFVHNQNNTRVRRVGLSFEELRGSAPNLIMTAVTPFGQSGPYADWKACNMVISHLAGLGVLTSWAGMDPEVVAPVIPAGYFVDFFAGACAATATLAGLFARNSTGEPQLVDVSEWDAGVLSAFHHILYPAYEGRAPNFRRAHRVARAPMGYMKCSDGYVWASALTPKHWEAFTKILDVPELADEPLFATALSRGEYWDALEPILANKMGSRPRDSVFHAFQERGIPIVPLYDVKEAVRSEQVAAREVIETVDHPLVGSLTLPRNPCRLSATPPKTGRAPLLGEHTQAVLAEISKSVQGLNGRIWNEVSLTGHSALPLAGLRVLDLSWVLAGPLCTQMLVELGAEVIKVESDRVVDISRGNPPFAGGEEHRESSGFFAALAAGKKTFTVDMSTAAGLSLVRSLAKTSDVVVENFSPGTLDRLGLGYAELKRLRRGIVLTSISGVGQTGPLCRYRFFGLQIFAMSGLSWLTGRPDVAPAVTRGSGSDPLGAIYACMGTLIAVLHQLRTGEGQQIDVSMLEAVLATIPDAVMEVTNNQRVPERQEDSVPDHEMAQCFRCRGNDAWVAIAVHNHEEWQRLRMVIGQPSCDGTRSEPAADHTGKAALIDHISAWTADRTPVEVMERMQAEGVPAGASYDATDIVSDRHFRARSLMREIDHHVYGLRLAPGAPWKISGITSDLVGREVPTMGEYNRYVLTDILGLPPESVNELALSGVVPMPGANDT